jgi:two-component system, NtrC family, sensor kinase
MAAVRGTLLIIDDEPTLTTVLSRCFGRTHDVAVAHDGREALAIIEAGRRFDVVICDWMMPRMCGQAFVCALAELDPAQAQRVVVMTGDPEAVEKAAVAQFVLEKPFAPSELRALVDRIHQAAEMGYFPAPRAATR